MSESKPKKRPCLFSDIYPSTKKTSAQKEQENKQYYSKFEYQKGDTPNKEKPIIEIEDAGGDDFLTKPRSAPKDKDEKDEAREARMAEIDDQEDDITQKVNGSFMGLTFAVSGNYKNITRLKLEEFIDKCKGKMHYSVSKKTHFLVLGHILEDGRGPEEGMKYKKA